MIKIPNPFPYQGSKRNLAKFILPLFSPNVATLYEPFAGSAAISIAAALYNKASYFHLNDVNQPLMSLWSEIINRPNEIAKQYEKLWNEQKEDTKKYYKVIRDEFNKTKHPHYLLYLLARCVKAAVRYNANGEFNQSPDNRRLGRNPAQMKIDILAVSKLLKNKTSLTSIDYRDVLEMSTPKDLIYMDPPYQGVCATRDSRYFSGIDFNEFMEALRKLNKRNVPFILSYDGRTGKKSYGQNLPDDLEVFRIELDAGRSTQATLLGRNDITYESVYISKNLTNNFSLDLQSVTSNYVIHQPALI
jgi:DNA adenine methylase